VIRSCAMLALILALAPFSCARAGALEPICRVPSVVDVMAREVHKRDYYGRIEPDLIDQFPYAAPNTVLCGVPVWTLSYDAHLADGIPLGRFEQYGFTVQALSNGFLVRYLRKGGWVQVQR
jgi:hypothetical protein